MGKWFDVYRGSHLQAKAYAKKKDWRVWKILHSDGYVQYYAGTHLPKDIIKKGESGALKTKGIYP